MKKVSKILTVSVLLATSLFGTDEEIIQFEKNRISQNPNVNIVDIKINTKKQLPASNWNGYILDVKAKIAGKEVNGKDILFSNEKYIALDLLDLKSGKSLKDLITPNLDTKYYDKSKLIAGNHNAKDKIVIFSDPLCPFCMDYIPDVIKHVNKNNDSIALYYYHFPLLRLHPAALPLSKAMDIAKEKGVKDIELKVYEADWDKYFTSKTTDEKKILDAFNKEFGLNIKLSELKNKLVQEKIEFDIKRGEDIMVQGTPTIFVNGKKDNKKIKYLELGK